MEVKANKRIHIKTAHEEQFRRMERDFVCFVNSDLYEAFTSLLGVAYKDLYWWFSKWTKEDFNLDFDFCKANDLRILRELVIDKFKTIQPILYYSNVVKSKDGWMRLWVSEHMGKEIKRYDKRKYNELFNSSSNNSSRF
jgi:hypothetical protein